LHARLASEALLLALMRRVMPVETKLLLIASLLLASDMTIAGEEPVERCRVPPKVMPHDVADGSIGRA